MDKETFESWRKLDTKFRERIKEVIRIISSATDLYGTYEAKTIPPEHYFIEGDKVKGEYLEPGYTQGFSSYGPYERSYSFPLSYLFMSDGEVMAELDNRLREQRRENERYEQERQSRIRKEKEAELERARKYAKELEEELGNES